MLATEISTDPHSSPARQAEPLEAESSVSTVKVYTRHNRSCPKRDRPDWARCNCVKWLYVYRNGKDTLTSAKTRSWEKAEQKAREVRDTFDPIRQLQRRLEAQSSDAIILHRREYTPKWYSVPMEPLADRPVFLIEQPDYVTPEIANFVRERLAACVTPPGLHHS